MPLISDELKPAPTWFVILNPGFWLPLSRRFVAGHQGRSPWLVLVKCKEIQDKESILVMELVYTRRIVLAGAGTSVVSCDRIAAAGQSQ